MPVEEGAVDSGCASDSGCTDLGALGGGVVQRGDDALAPACGVGVAAVEHRPGACVRRSGRACALRPCGGAHAVASEVRAIVTGGAGAAANGLALRSDVIS